MPTPRRVLLFNNHAFLFIFVMIMRCSLGVHVVFGAIFHDRRGNDVEAAAETRRDQRSG